MADAKAVATKARADAGAAKAKLEAAELRMEAIELETEEKLLAFSERGSYVSKLTTSKISLPSRSIATKFIKIT